MTCCGLSALYAQVSGSIVTEGAAYRPLNTGLRFSMKAVWPSL